MVGRQRLFVFAAITIATLLFALYALTTQYLPDREEVTFQHTPVGPSYSWNVGHSGSIVMEFQNSINYQLNGSAADTQWQALIPEDGGLIFIGRDKEPFMLSMFHQLRCLDIVRHSYIEGWEGIGSKRSKALSRHCMNYLRQMVLCRGDRRLERVVSPYGEHAVQVRDPQTCKDWRKIYNSVKRQNERSSRFSI